MGLDPSQYRAIELAINATGQFGVADLEARVQALKAAIAAEQAQLAAGGPVNDKAIADFAKLATELRDATEAAAAGNRVLAGQAAALKSTTGAAQGASRAMLEFSRAAEDFSTGGFLGIVNNVPGIVRGIGQAASLAAPQVMALETAASLVATGAFTLWKNWGSIKELWGDGTGPKLIPDLKEVNKQLDELRAKPVKSLIDVQDIENAEKMVDRLTRINGALAAQKAAPEEDKKRGEIVSKGISEATGGDSTKIDQAIVASRQNEVSPEMGAIRQKVANLTAKIAAFREQGLNEMASDAEGGYDDLRKQIEAQKPIDKQNRFAAAEQMRGRAGSGDEQARKYLADLYDANKGKFDAVGVNDKFRKSLDDADPRIQEEAKRQKEADKVFKDEQERSDRELKEREGQIRETIAKVRTGYDDALIKNVFDALKAGSTPEQAGQGQRADLIAGLKGRGVGDAIVGPVATALIEKAVDAAQNLINEGDTPKVDKQATIAKHKTDTAHDKAVSEATTRAKGGYRDAAEAELFKEIAAGGNGDQLAAQMQPDYVKALTDRGGIDPSIVQDVAKKILDGALESAKNHLDSNTLPTGLKKQEHDRDAVAKKFSAAFTPEIEAAMSQNRINQLQGAPIARSAQQERGYQQSGQTYALPEAELERRIEAEVGKRLKVSGQDPSLAHGVTQHALEEFQNDATKAVAQSGNQIDALISVNRDSQGMMAGVLQQAQRRDADIQQLQMNNQMLFNQARKSTQQRPALIQF